MLDECRTATACFTGHRPQRLPWGFDESDVRCSALLDKLRERITFAADTGYTHFLCGGAIGVDIWCGELVAELRERRECITLEVVVPCADQDKSWPHASRERYRAMLDSADRVLVLHESYTTSCMMERNRNMTSRSGLLIAVFDGVYRGGTWQTIKMAIRERVEIDMLAPI